VKCEFTSLLIELQVQEHRCAGIFLIVVEVFQSLDLCISTGCCDDIKKIHNNKKQAHAILKEESTSNSLYLSIDLDFGEYIFIFSTC
jgi:hypothetical protein